MCLFRVGMGVVMKQEDTKKKILEKALELTASNTGLQFNIALNYGGREEILRAVKAIAAKAQEGLIAPEDIDYDMISSQLYTGMYDVPDPDVVIRTSGEERLSNFLLWQAAYSEFVFSDVLWPDFTQEEYEKCLEEFQGRDRRFGGR